MATLYSDQAKKMFGQSTAGIFEQAKGSEARGKVRTMVWDFIVPAGGAAINDVIVLGVLPKGARVLGGREWHQAMSTGAGAATGQIGIYSRDIANALTVVDDDAYLAATSFDAAGATDLANTEALKMLDAGLADERVVAAKVTVEAWAAGAKFVGYLKYIAPDN